ncbi:MAG: hypothetical protein D6758_03730 [Gammaproteobacteria bacterium]|nr:MAG: hypothetical protein D6758_03730 [Gammaproteobacteria bacterium]
METRISISALVFLCATATLASEVSLADMELWNKQPDTGIACKPGQANLNRLEIMALADLAAKQGGQITSARRDVMSDASGKYIHDIAHQSDVIIDRGIRSQTFTFEGQTCVRVESDKLHESL